MIKCDSTTVIRTSHVRCSPYSIRFIRHFPFTRKIPHLIRLFHAIGIFPLKTSIFVEYIITIFIFLNDLYR